MATSVKAFRLRGVESWSQFNFAVANFVFSTSEFQFKIIKKGTKTSFLNVMYLGFKSNG